MKKMLTKGAQALTLAYLGASTAFAQADFGQRAPGKIADATGNADNASDLITTIVNYFLGFLGLIAVLMIIYGGVLYVTAGTDAGKVDKAKKMIMYAITGIIIVFLSFALVNTVLKAGLGAGSNS